NFIQKTSSYSFLENPSNEFTVEIPTRISGDTLSRERFFRVKLIQDSLTTAASNQFEIQQGIVGSGAFEGLLQLKVFNSKQLDTTEVSVHLQLTDSEDFRRGNVESMDHVFTWTNKVIVPDWRYYRFFFCSYPSTA